MKILYVEWGDSSTSHGWQKAGDDYTPSACKSVGFLVQETKHSISLAESLTEEDPRSDRIIHGHGCVTTIPKVNISKRVVLRGKRDDS